MSSMKYELLVGLRYARAERTNHFVSFLSLVSISGIALGVAALIVVLSVVNGFEEEFRKGVLGATPHVQVSGYDGRLSRWEEVAKTAATVPGVIATAPFANAQALLSNDGKVRGAFLRGVVPALEDRAANLAQQMRVGTIDALVPGEHGVILGTELAKALGVTKGDRVALVSPQSTSVGSGPRLRALKVVGTFSVGFYDYDTTLAIMHIADVQALFDMGDRVSGVRLKLADPLQAQTAGLAVSRVVRDVAITDWTRGNGHLFHAVKTSKLMVVLVVSLLIAIATFNIVASLVMVVTDKEADIAILRTLGASPGGIMRVFMFQGALIGVAGTFIGIVVGVLLSINVPALAEWTERTTGFQPINAEIYHISQLPSDLQAVDVMLTAVVALVLALLATIYPSYRASQQRPAEALRYE
jgi:lipoprotein-releasing system permease protein